MYTYINCSEELALLDFFVSLEKVHYKKMKGEVNSTSESKQSGVQSQFLLTFVAGND